ncbi:hypothetical protein Fcan01_19304 [Folsomia candida]|uniref:Uncharacterized protein n=1 Tax=Folsomia candida TaxID=158441 RepID=A0A226DK44_FOLCA|nr:hypothetical protein Fcan01_19304 [Folsomia candida]
MRQDSVWEKMTCIKKIKFTERNYPYAVEVHRSNREEWCVDETQISPNIMNKGYLGRTEIAVNQLAFQIYSNANVTLAKFIACSTPRDRHVQLKFSLANRPNSLVLIETAFEGYQFLTCYSEPYISLDFYISPFQTEVWVVLGTTISTIIGLTTVLQHFSTLLEQQPFSIWMYVLATLFDEGGFIPSRAERHTFFRISLGIWGIMSVVLTNGYITPLKALPEFLGVLLSLASHYSLDHVIPEAFKDLILWSPKHAFFRKNFSYLDGTLTFSILRRNIEREVLQCGKTVFVGKSSEITVEYEFLSRKYPDVKFFMSGESIQNYPSGISIRNGWNSRVIRGFKSVVEAGIWSYVEKVELRGKNLNRTPAFVSEKMKDDRPVNIATLKGTWPTVFVLVGCLISINSTNILQNMSAISPSSCSMNNCCPTCGTLINNCLDFYEPNVTTHRHRCCSVFILFLYSVIFVCLLA